MRAKCLTNQIFPAKMERHTEGLEPQSVPNRPEPVGGDHMTADAANMAILSPESTAISDDAWQPIGDVAKRLIGGNP